MNERDLLRHLLPAKLAEYGENLQFTGLKQKKTVAWITFAVVILLLVAFMLTTRNGLTVVAIIIACVAMIKQLDKLNPVDYIIDCAEKAPYTDLNEIIEQELMR